MSKITKGFKGFRWDGTCRGMQYETDKTYTVDSKKKLVCCTNSGLHFCIEPVDVWDYYPPSLGKYAQVQTNTKCVESDIVLPEDSKRATRKLTIGSCFYSAFEYAKNFFVKLKRRITTDYAAVYVGPGYANTHGRAVGVGVNMCLESSFAAGFCVNSAISGKCLAFAEGHGNLVESEEIAIGMNCKASVTAKGGIAITSDTAVGVLGSRLVFISNIYPIKAYVFVVDGKKVKPGVSYYCCNGHLYEV